jgi:hypothetical protein
MMDRGRRDMQNGEVVMIDHQPTKDLSRRDFFDTGRVVGGGSRHRRRERLLPDSSTGGISR